jgi:threonylcarbamoyladenosine tRNA methylthiotransferase MtaB
MKFSILTFGCKVNQYDSQEMREALGVFMSEAGRGEKAEVVVVNTCTVTAEADRQSRQAMRRLRRANPRAKIIASGCYARRASDELLKEGLADVVVQGTGPGPLLDALGMPERKGAPGHGIGAFAGHARAFVKVQDGCDRRCAFCIVPAVRGKSESRPAREIIAEIQGLARGGVPEVVLCGVRLNAYRDPENGGKLASLVEGLLAIPELIRLRLSSIYPGDVEPELIALLAGHPRMCRHAHLPVQSGSDAVLSAMRRGYTAGDIRALAGELRRIAPNMGLTADIIAGFPGETDGDVRATMDLLSGCGFHRLHLFPFSARPGTPAAALKPVPAPLIKERMGMLAELGKTLLIKSQEREVGREAEVVVEARERGGWRRGVTDNYHTVMFQGASGNAGALARLRITGIEDGALRGVPAGGG